MFDKRKIVNIVNSMNEAPYKLGGTSVSEGFDCLSYLWFFYTQAGADFPKIHNKVTIRNYLSKYRTDPQRAKRQFAGFLKRLGEKIDINFILPGDLLIIKPDTETAETEPNTCIYIGAGNVMTCDVRLGILIAPKNRIKNIREARRLCRKRSPS